MKKMLFLISILISMSLHGMSVSNSFSLKNVELINNPNKKAPLVGKLSLGETDKFDKIIIHISGNNRLWDLEYSKNSENIYPIVGLKANKKYDVTFTLYSNSDFYKYSDILKIQTPKLPKDPLAFPKIELSIKNKALMQKGFTLFNPRRETKDSKLNTEWGMLTVVDEDGEVVWYYEANSRISDFDVLKDGLISFMTADHRIIIIDMFGNTIKSYHSRFYKGNKQNSILVDVDTFHHDVTQLPNGNFVVLSSEARKIDNYYTSERDENAPRKTQNVIGDVVVEFDITGKILWKWNAFDYLDPYRIGYETFSGYWNRRGYKDSVDWSHANFVRYDKKDDSFYVNFRYLSSIIKIDKKSKEIVWIFGEPSGYSKDEEKKLIKLASNSLYPWHQHSPKILADNEILFFNNDNYRARPFDKPIDFDKTESFAVKYKINPITLEAKETWSSRNIGQKLNSVAMGDVDSLDNGNILASFGALVKKLPKDFEVWSNTRKLPAEDKLSMIREYSISPSTKIVWELKLSSLNNSSNAAWSIFGGERFNFFGMNRR